jgi:hypothetical protein
MPTRKDCPDQETCRRLMKLGYARSKRVRIYGQEVEILSDPFPDDEGRIAVEVAAKQNVKSRTIKLPLSVVEVAKQGPGKRAA